MTFGNRKFTGFLGAATVVIIAEYILVLSDYVISGRVLGETALGAMNLLMPVFSTVSFFTWLLAVGTSIVYSDAIGRANAEKAAKLAGQGLLAAFGMGVLLVVATFLLQTPYLAFMAPDEATMAFSGAYWKWYPLVVILESIDMVLLYLVYTDGGELPCLFSYVGQVVVNIASSYWLCMRMGMEGVSLGTVLAYLVGIAALLPRVLSRECGLRFKPYFNVKELLHSLRASFGDASAGLFHALLFFVITKYVLYCWGPETLPITAVVFCIVRLTVFFNGVGIALQPLETVYHGEDNETAVAKLVRFAAAVSFAEGLILSAVIFVAPELIIGLVGIDDPELVVAAKRAARMTVIGLSGYAVTYMLNSHYQYVGRPDRSVKLTALAFFLAPVVLMLVFGSYVGMDGVWIALAGGPACALFSFLPLLKRTRQQGPLPWMRTLHLWKPGKVDAAVREVRHILDSEQYCETAVTGIVATLQRAIQAIDEGNVGRKVNVELTLDRRRGVRLVIRDDGRELSLRDAGAPDCVHMPAAGFNRNILVWDRVRKANDVEQAPLNYLQGYVLARLESTSDPNMFNLAKLFRLRRGIDLQRLSESLVASARSHAALLTVLHRAEDGSVVQRKEFSEDAIRCPIVKISERELFARKGDLVRSFDVFGECLLDAKIYDCGDCAYLLSNFHHLVCDGYSFPLILEGARKIWNGETLVPDTYYDVLARREARAASPLSEATRGFYRSLVSSGDFVSLPKDDFCGSSGYGAYETVLAIPNGFDDFLTAHRITRHHVFLAATAVALARLTGSDEILIDWVFHGRVSKEEMRTVGAFMVDLPLFADRISELTASDMIACVKQATFRGIKNVGSIRDFRDFNPNGQERLTFIYQDEWGELMSPGPVRADGPFAWMIEETMPLAAPTVHTENPFNVEIMEHGDSTRLFLEYDSGRYAKATVCRYAELYQAAIEWLLKGSV